MITIAASFVVATLALAVSELISDELRGWLELAPRGILRLAAMRLPSGLRQTIYKEEWLPELIFILRKADGRPITRMIIGTWYSVSMIRSAGRVGHSLHRVRDERRMDTRFGRLITRPRNSSRVIQTLESRWAARSDGSWNQ